MKKTNGELYMHVTSENYIQEEPNKHWTMFGVQVEERNRFAVENCNVPWNNGSSRTSTDETTQTKIFAP